MENIKFKYYKGLSLINEEVATFERGMNKAFALAQKNGTPIHLHAFSTKSNTWSYWGEFEKDGETVKESNIGSFGWCKSFPELNCRNIKFKLQ